MLRLITFGGVGLESDDGSAPSRLRPPRLALLAVLAAAGERGVSRERIAGLLWPESDEQRASHSLRQARYALRSELDLEVIRSEGSVLSLDSATITSDVAEFHAALAGGDRRRAVSLVRGPFLDGFYLPGASDFERWVEEERARLAEATSSALLSLAERGVAGQGKPMRRWKWVACADVRDPLSGRSALGYVKPLAAAAIAGRVRRSSANIRHSCAVSSRPSRMRKIETSRGRSPRSIPSSIMERRTPLRRSSGRGGRADRIAEPSRAPRLTRRGQAKPGAAKSDRDGRSPSSC